jgi:hypothetical protein
MNLFKEHPAKNLIEAMPADLRALYEKASPRINPSEEKWYWEEFINQSFTWSETDQGHGFWSEVGQMEHFDNYEIIKFMHLPATIREHIKSTPEYLRAIILEEFESITPEEDKTAFFNAFNNNLQYAYLDLRGQWKTFIEREVPNRKFPRNFWKEIAKAISYTDADNIARYQLQEVEIYGGGMARRCDLVKLSSECYGANAFTTKELVTDSSNGLILIADLVEYYDQNTDKRRAHKRILEKQYERGGYIVPAVIFCPSPNAYLDSRISYRYGVGINYKTKQPEKVSLDSHVLVRLGSSFRFTCKKEDIETDENLVFINHSEFQYKVYMDKNSPAVYVDAVTGNYYFEDVDPWKEYRFHETAGAPRQMIRICSNNSIPRNFEYNGQRFSPVHTQLEHSFNGVWFFSRESAENAGLILSTCEHCGNLHSQYHDRIQCAHDNFVNERFGYHSQRPRYISSRSKFKIGVEIEKESFAGARHNNREIFRAFGWVKESDSSLDGRIGYELVSPAFGLFGNNLIKEAEKLEAKFPSLINGETSNACGGHIHFSRANTSGADTLELYCGYLPLLYSIYKTRTKRDYCKGKEKEELKYSRDKYQAVRVLDNRIEFRIFPAVKNVKTLAWRIELLRYMAKNPTASPVQVVNDLCDKRTKLHKLFLEIFTEKTIYARAIDTLNMAQKYDRNYYNIDFSKERTAIAKKAEKTKAR